MEFFDWSKGCVYFGSYVSWSSLTPLRLDRVVEGVEDSSEVRKSISPCLNSSLLAKLLSLLLLSILVEFFVEYTSVL